VIDLSKARVYARTDSKEKLPEAVRRMTEKLAVNIEDYPAERKRPLALASRQTKKPKKADALNLEELRSLAIDLSRDKEYFGAKDVQLSLKLESEEGANHLIDKMLDRGIIFQPQVGRFRIV